MKESTLIIPAKKEPNALPIVLNELRRNYPTINILVIMQKNDEETFEAIKNYDCNSGIGRWWMGLFTNDSNMKKKRRTSAKNYSTGMER